MTCTATVHVVGIGTFTCDADAGHDGAHVASLPAGDKWATVMWRGDNAVIAPPGSRRRLAWRRPA